MLSLAARILLFISSYLPLILIFILLNIGTNVGWSVILCLVAAIALFGLFMFFRFVNSTNPRIQEVLKVERKDTEAMAYIVTYLLPFLGLDFSDYWNILSLGIFFFILGVIYINSNMIGINPTLNLMGYHLFNIESPSGTVHTIITKRKRIFRGDRLNVVVVDDDLMVGRE